jgi:ubiquinone/menaquinone biosynthesis C-methylase UbiE
VKQCRTIERWVAGARARWALSKLAPFLAPSQRVLNLGSGDGVLSEMIRQRCCCEVVDVDIADMSLVRDHPPIVYDGRNLPFPPKSFDFVLLLHVLHHCPDHAQVIREAARVCRGAVLVIEDTHETDRDLFWLRMIHTYLDKVEDMPLADCRFLTPKGWIALFEHAGLRLETLRRWPRYMGFLPPGNHLFVLRPI